MIGEGLGAGLGTGIAVGASHGSSGAIVGAGAGAALLGTAIGALIAHDYCAPESTSPPPYSMASSVTPLPWRPAAASPLNREQIASLPPPMRERIVLRGVHFEVGKAAIRATDATSLDQTVAVLLAHPVLRVNVEGYADSQEARAHDQQLSEQRAKTVADYLEAHGIASSRMQVRGFGASAFLDTNDTAEGRAENRRVELMPAN